jgi:hypothetical protein
MCDYSLHLVTSRPAKVGDKLVSTKFTNSSTRGFAAIGEPNVAVCLLPGMADGLVPRQDAARVDHAHFGLVRRERALDLRHRQCRNEVHGHECLRSATARIPGIKCMPQRDYGSGHASPGPHSSASLRREYLPRTHKCMATVENHPGSLSPPKIWKTSCPDDCMSPTLYPSSRTCDAEDTLCCG